MKNRFNEKGIALVVVLMVMLVLLTMAVATITLTVFELRHSGVDLANQQAYYVAKGAASYGMAVLDSLADAQTMPAAGDTITIQMPAGVYDDYEFLTDSEWTDLGITIVGLADTVKTVDIRSQFNGMAAFVNSAQAEGRARGHRNERALVTQVLEVQAFPVFEFASLYDEDWTLNAPLTMSGRVHTNSNATVDVPSGTARFYNLTGDGTVLTARGIYNAGSNAYFLKATGDTSEDVTSTNDWATAAGNAHDLRLAQDSIYAIKAVDLPLTTDNHRLIEPQDPADDPTLQNLKFSWQATMRIETVPRQSAKFSDTTKVWIPIRPQYAATATPSIFYQLMMDEALVDEQLRRNKEIVVGDSTNSYASVWRTPNCMSNEWSFASNEDVNSQNKIQVCHMPPGNRGQYHEINISASGARAHLSHGCYLGPCCTAVCAAGDTITLGPFSNDSPAPGNYNNPPCPAFSEDTLRFYVGDSYPIANFVWRRANWSSDDATLNNREIEYDDAGSGDVRSQAMAAFFNGSSTASYTFTNADIGVHPLKAKILAGVYGTTGPSGPGPRYNPTYIKVYANPNGDDGGSTPVVKEICGRSHAYTELNPPQGQTGHWANENNVPATAWNGDEDGDGLYGYRDGAGGLSPECNDPDCFWYGEWDNPGNNWTELCSYSTTGYASLYDDKENVWLSATNINLENFIKDTLMAEFSRTATGNYLPSGISIPANLQFTDRAAVYIQRPTGFDPLLDRVLDWTPDTLATQPYATVGCLGVVCPGDEPINQIVCVTCAGEPTTMVVQIQPGQNLADAMNALTNQQCRQMGAYTTGPCQPRDVVLIPVVDVLRDPPFVPGSATERYEPFTLWATDVRDTFFNANPDSILRARFANSGVFPSTVNNTAPFLSGVRLLNGDSLATWYVSKGLNAYQALTVASDKPMYVQGDYNTNGGNNNSRLPAAVMGDQVTILSNAWADSVSNQALGNRDASVTIQNFAIMSGKNDDDEGGVENLPRFMEDWSGVTHTWLTSLVCLFDSEIATTPYESGSWSQVPNRNWNFDSRFMQPTALPPGTPRVTMRDQQRATFNRADENW